MTSNEPNTIRTEKRDGVVIITIDRVSARNAFDYATACRMEAALDDMEADASISVGIITGAGGFFSAGQDLKAAARGETALTSKRGGFGIMAQPAVKPLIAAVEGPALAGGFELALSCDLIVAARDSVFGLPEVKRSLLAVGGALFRLPRRIPYHVAMEMIFTGDPQSAESLQRFGLINRIAEPGNVLNAAMELAQAIAQNGPLALRAAKEIVMLAQQEGWAEGDAWQKQMGIAAPVFASEDFREGLAAFMEKRSPVWPSRKRAGQ